MKETLRDLRLDGPASKRSADRSPTIRGRVYDKPFSERVTQPTQAWLANLARTISGVNWSRNMARRLEMAGNPPGWDSERILAWKAIAAIGFASIVGGILLVSGPHASCHPLGGRLRRVRLLPAGHAGHQQGPAPI